MNARLHSDPPASDGKAAAPDAPREIASVAGDAATADALRMVVSQVIGERQPGAPTPYAGAVADAPPSQSHATAMMAPAGTTPVNAAPVAMPTPAQQAGAAAEMVSVTGLPAVLPRLSEYRIAQVGKSAAAFEREQELFWQSSQPLATLRGEMERIARERGVPLQDIAEKMKPDGDLAALRVSFNDAVAQSPEAGQHKKAMDKALDSYTRQYGRAQEEILNPDLHDNPHYDALKARLVQSHANMQEQAGRMPALLNDKGAYEASPLQKLTQSVEKIMERVDAIGQEFESMMRAKRSSAASEPGF